MQSLFRHLENRGQFLSRRVSDYFTHPEAWQRHIPFAIIMIGLLFFCNYYAAVLVAYPAFAITHSLLPAEMMPMLVGHPYISFLLILISNFGVLAAALGMASFTTVSSEDYDQIRNLEPPSWQGSLQIASVFCLSFLFHFMFLSMSPVFAYIVLSAALFLTFNCCPEFRTSVREPNEIVTATPEASADGFSSEFTDAHTHSTAMSVSMSSSSSNVSARTSNDEDSSKQSVSEIRKQMQEQIQKTTGREINKEDEQEEFSAGQLSI